MKKRKICLLLAGVLLLGCIAAGFLRPQALSAGSWGLSFQTPGQPPQGNAQASQLSRYDAAFLGDTQQKVLYLTFDAGYENGYTEKILDVLQRQQIPAAFFLTGHYLQSNADLVRRMAAEGHTVGNHTMGHPDMRKLTQMDVFAPELTDLEALYKDITGSDLPKFYRPPQGLYSQENLALAQQLGYRTVFWSLAYADWDNQAQPDPNQALEKLLGRLHNGAVILLHATSATNAQILEDFLTACREKGYRFAPLEELF